ncbi:hypothetical protein Poly59_13910 [Rubripirellula reticaptiva]|uniref:Uncharacterized protein n=1 Tax=Rubripirellula reticaptiva TaxID=2528013 RepID=A0A5C6F1Y0_9BACT|nr:hypothetical protein Poly59_13910 [Rubripirellula reticaptiva]
MEFVATGFAKPLRIDSHAHDFQSWSCLPFAANKIGKVDRLGDVDKGQARVSRLAGKRYPILPPREASPTTCVAAKRGCPIVPRTIASTGKQTQRPCRSTPPPSRAQFSIPHTHIKNRPHRSFPPPDKPIPRQAEPYNQSIQTGNFQYTRCTMSLYLRPQEVRSRNHPLPCTH